MATIDVQVGAPSGDIAHRLLPVDVLTGFHILGNISGSWTGVSLYMLFPTVNVPNAATIDTAFITMTNEFAQTGNVVRAKLEASDVDSASDISTDTAWHAAVKTTANVTQDGITNGVVNVEFQFNEMKTVIQELVDRPGWLANNNMGLFIDDTGLNSDVGANRRYWDYDASPSKSGKLHIEFTVGTPGYIIEVDWDDDDVFGSFPDENITKDVRSLTFDRGRDTELDNMPAGTLILTLNDTSGDYSPENTSTRFGSGNVTLNRRVRVRFFDGSFFPLWQGRITGITPHPAPEDRTATITAADEFEQFGRLDVEGPADEPLEDVLIGAPTTGPLESLLDFMNFPSGDRILDTGQTLLNIWWERGKKGLDAISDLMKIEQGLSYIDRAGKFRFEDRHHRLVGTVNPHRVSQFTFDRSMVGFDYDFSGRTVKNVARVTIHDREIAAGAPDPGTTVIFATPLRPRIKANGKLTIRATYDQPARDITFPTKTGDYRIDSSPSGTGDAVLESNVPFVFLAHGQSMDLSFTNNNNTPVFIVPGDSVADPNTTLEIRGNLYGDDTLIWEEGDEIPSTPSVAEFGKRSIDIDSEFVSSPAFANDLALFLKARFEQPQPDFVRMTVYGSTDALLAALLTLEIHDRVTVTESQLGISRDYFINRLEHTADVEFGKIVQVTYSLARADADNFWVLEDPILGLLGITTILGF